VSRTLVIRDSVDLATLACALQLQAVEEERDACALREGRRTARQPDADTWSAATRERCAQACEKRCAVALRMLGELDGGSP
jgi:hypothetical protein